MTIADVVVENFSDMFPELATRKEYVQSVIGERLLIYHQNYYHYHYHDHHTCCLADEESSFNRTLDQGVKHFNKVCTALLSSGTYYDSDDGDDD